ncbi:MAG: DUF4332 domain-containing protein [Candidatus Promineifilaceae bacterium]|nr:DUF4332 domain-containing protein [Candidatus Promineifilaceae bacterium]
MIRRLFCFGLGLADLFIEKFDELACAGEERLAAQKNANRVTDAKQSADVQQEPVLKSVSKTAAEADDLTSIKGIGPTFARRLKEAGITTYEELAALSADQLREITQAADWQADPNEWILQAKVVA